MEWWRIIRISIRLFCASVFLLTSIKFSLTTVLSLATVISTYYIPWKDKTTSKTTPHHRKNSQREKDAFDASLDSLPEQKKSKTLEELAQFLIPENPTQSESLSLFHNLKINSDCLFARKSRLWGSPKWDVTLSISENVMNLIPVFYLFCQLCTHLNLDGFVIAIPLQLAHDFDTFLKTVTSLLTSIAFKDPTSINCMKLNGLLTKHPGWKFEFDNITFFVSGFASFYPENHSRYAFGSDYGFLLFQPDTSFARHDLPPNSMTTNREHPMTVRDRIRCAFENAGRAYHVPQVMNSSQFEEIVRDPST